MSSKETNTKKKRHSEQSEESKPTNKKEKKPEVLDINKAENIELTFTIDGDLYAIEPKPNCELASKICLETIIRLAMDVHDPIKIIDENINELEENLKNITKEKL